MPAQQMPPPPPQAQPSHQTRQAYGTAAGLGGQSSGGGDSGSGGDGGAGGPAPGRRRFLIGAAVAVLLAVGANAYFGGGGPANDQVSQQQKQSWAAGYLAAAPVHLSRVPASETATAIKQMQLPAAVEQTLRDRVSTGQTHLVWVTLWDTMAEDGDTVQITSGGFSLPPVKLVNAQRKIAVPEPEDGILNVTGIYDGGGGITVGMISGEQPVNLPVMDVGQVLAVPVAVSP